MRARMLVYAVLLGALVVGFGVAVALRNPVDIDVLRDRNALYRLLDDERIENVYTVRLMNKDVREHRFQLSTSGLPGLTLDTEREPVVVAAGAAQAVAVRLRAPKGTPAGSSKVTIRATAVDDGSLMAESKARFISPGRGMEEEDEHHD